MHMPAPQIEASVWREDFPARDGIVEAIGPLSGRNRVAAAFYDGPEWARFRPWEHAFLSLQGGQERARRPILAHLPKVSGRLLEVGVGDGDNLPFLGPGWDVYAVDIARSRLEGCLRRFPALAGRLAWAEAERLPFADASFDACLCVGGFNYFGEHEAAIGELRRVTRPGGVMVVADEAPWLHRCGIGHLIGLPSIDAAWLRLLGLGPDFVAMVLAQRIDLGSLFPERGGWRRTTIWRGLGYCMTGRS
ncbi:class I SAM-dependent methyltransferase [Planctomyces sp. SH-PL62]|uniref:class I SAM-dependent methyltransferase n=1 Tax=Planctomyces sp. SH-PL62 TaxID=1636152 RepID=UPI00078D5503|nr:class I SAM-dependent methyltransferase [Planctomyces sp. SH-PL62]AMV38759.1 Demethylrebeccamycin-D-glucose O-methyltransferase [Planctomyces sp. SH-PL62]